MNCLACTLSGNEVPGDGPRDAKIAMIGEAPGVNEDRTHIPFTGQAGKVLNELLALGGFQRSEVYIDNMVRCRPPKNQKPTPKMIQACRGHFDPWEADPDIVVLLGSTPISTLTPDLSLKSHHGLVVERELFGRKRKVVLMYHPASGFYKPQNRAVMAQDWARLQERLRELSAVVQPREHVEVGSLVIDQDTAIDTETEELGAQTAKIVCMSAANSTGLYWLEEPKIDYRSGAIIGWNLKYDLHVLQRYGIMFPTAVLRDGMIAAYLCGEGSLGLKGLSKRYLNWELGHLEPLLAQTEESLLERYLASLSSQEFSKTQRKSYEAIMAAENKHQALSRRHGFRETFGEPPVANVQDVLDIMPVELKKYSVEDSESTRALWPVFEHKMKEMGVEHLFYDIEMPLVPILIDMERRGMAVDRERAKELGHLWKGEMDKLAGELRYSLGLENPGSSQQVGEVVFNVLGHKPLALTDSGAPSTSAWVLERLAEDDPDVRKILDWRKLSKLKSTYLEPWLRQDGRIHAEFNQVRQHGEDAEGATVTGRLSSSGPNFQNVPTRTKEGKQVRSCIVAEPGNTLVSVDFKQLEWVLMGVGAQDEELLEAYRTHADVHQQNADLMGVDRYTGKRITYLWGFGGGPGKLAQLLGVPKSVCEGYIRKLEAGHPKLYQWRWSEVDKAKERGYAMTLWGRRRYIPELLVAETEYEYYEAAKQAFNMFPQGTAADIAKLGVQLVQNVLRTHELISETTGLLAPIHDEVLMELPKSAVTKELLEELMTAMADAGVGLPVRLQTDCEIGDRWGEMKEVKWEN